MLELETPQPAHDPSQEQGKRRGPMDHPILSFVSIAIILGAIGFIVVARRTATDLPASQVGGWDGTIQSLFNEGGVQSAPVGINNDVPSPDQAGSGASPAIPKLAPDVSEAASSPQQGQNSDLGYQQIIAAAQGSTGKPIGITRPVNTQISYDFVPPTLVATTAVTITRTPTQRALYEYGNAVGAYVQSFEQAHSNQTQVLKDQIEDRSSAAKNAAVVQLGKAYQTLGKNIEEIQIVPPEMASQNTALANGYIELGKNLALVPNAKNSDDLLKAIKTYNDSANAFAKNFAAIAGALASYDVAFSQTDPGIVFQFSYQSGGQL